MYISSAQAWITVLSANAPCRLRLTVPPMQTFRGWAKTSQPFSAFSGPSSPNLTGV